MPISRYSSPLLFLSILLFRIYSHAPIYHIATLISPFMIRLFVQKLPTLRLSDMSNRLRFRYPVFCFIPLITLPLHQFPCIPIVSIHMSNQLLLRYPVLCFIPLITLPLHQFPCIPIASIHISNQLLLYLRYLFVYLFLLLFVIVRYKYEFLYFESNQSNEH
jgi:hypothetical protein